ncbi:thioredoxin, partial [Dysosmobacter welbionis]
PSGEAGAGPDAVCLPGHAGDLLRHRLHAAVLRCGARSGAAGRPLCAVGPGRLLRHPGSRFHHRGHGALCLHNSDRKPLLCGQCPGVSAGARALQAVHGGVPPDCHG